VNDPHVKTLYYKVLVSEDVDYENAPALSEIAEEFEFTLNYEKAIFTMKQHYSTVDDAKAVVESYIRAWNILIGLKHGPDSFKLKFLDADIIDRAPVSNKNDAAKFLGCSSLSSAPAFRGEVHAHISHAEFPPFPKNFKESPEAETMYLRYKAYLKGRESLTSMAYMCLTVYKATADNLKDAAKKYCIDHNVLKNLGRLTSTKGGPEEVRKYPKNGTSDPLHPKEKEWIVSVVKSLILRAAEYVNKNETHFS
jgi:hypothetical protein